MRIVTLLICLGLLTGASTEDDFLAVARCDGISGIERLTVMTVGTKDNVFGAALSPSGETFPIIGMASMTDRSSGMVGVGGAMGLRFERDSDLKTTAIVIVTPDDDIKLRPVTGLQRVKSGGQVLRCYLLLDL